MLDSVIFLSIAVSAAHWSSGPQPQFCLLCLLTALPDEFKVSLCCAGNFHVLCLKGNLPRVILVIPKEQSHFFISNVEFLLEREKFVSEPLSYIWEKEKHKLLHTRHLSSKVTSNLFLQLKSPRRCLLFQRVLWIKFLQTLKEMLKSSILNHSLSHIHLSKLRNFNNMRAIGNDVKSQVFYFLPTKIKLLHSPILRQLLVMRYAILHLCVIWNYTTH